jgi:DNA-binding IclR family transcriptional regulator
MNHEVKSAARILELIEFLAGCSEPVSLKEITIALGYPKSSAHALAQTLVSRGYAIQDSTERYLLVHGNRHSTVRTREARLLSAAHPVMDSLRDQSGETVMLSVRTSRGEFKRLAKCVSRQAVRYDTDLDAAAASYCTAMGRVLLAYWEPPAVEAYFSRTQLVGYTRFTVTDPGHLREIVAQVREEGVAVNDQEFVAGATGIAAPVRDHEGQVAAALNLGTLTARFHARREEIIMAVKEAAAKINHRFGYRDPLANATVPPGRDAAAVHHRSRGQDLRACELPGGQQSHDRGSPARCGRASPWRR